MMGYGMGGFGLIGLVFNLAVIGGLIWLGFWAVKRFAPGGNFLPGGPTPREILQQRYARGEITREQYQQMLIDLS